MKNKLFLLILLVICLCLLSACENIFVSKPVDTPTSVTIEPSTTVTTTDSNSGNTETAIKEDKTEEKQYTEVKVSSAKDLLQNIKPYTRIILTEDYYNLSKINPELFSNENVFKENAFDGYEYIIHDIDHIEICSDKNVLAEIVTEAPHVNVISLKNCHDVKLDGIMAGHAVEKGYCSGGVVNLDNCSKIEIDNCHLYGCGTYGLIATNCSDITVNSSEIYECTYGLVDLYDDSNIEFNKCTFKDSEEFSMFSLTVCNNIRFNDCTITGNTSRGESLFVQTSECTKVSFNKCLFENNTYQYFGVKENFEMNSCKVKDENYNNVYYPDYSELDSYYESDYGEYIYDPQ